MEIDVIETDDGGTDVPVTDPDPDPDGGTVPVAEGPTYEYQWLPACGENYPGQPITFCAGAYNCPSPAEVSWSLWSRELPDGAWLVTSSECYAGEPPTEPGPGPGPPPQPVLTPAMVLAEVRSIGLPSVDLAVQPEGATLVNFDTIFYTSEPDFERTVNIVGYQVDLDADPTTYTWHAGDGTTWSTDDPGAPFPQESVTHRYSASGAVVSPRVDVTYEVRFRVDGGDWQPLSETLTADGDPVALDVREGTPLLTDPST